ncbi:hypothetical protein MTR67_047756 [Solanum verrucosum]|uniref:Uncharacterized protein n=1 Tax=Solanum verrucosum TaxID=315347 RepID=A0AAF0V0B4_SOLVR|nr:hypothetical protein MTR67_047756 [Solanum verrucosum]
MAIMGQQIQCCSIMKDITAIPFFPRSSLLHKRLGVVKSPDLVKKFHHAGDLNKTPAILVSSAFFQFSYFFHFMCSHFSVNQGKQSKNLQICQF